MSGKIDKAPAQTADPVAETPAAASPGDAAFLMRVIEDGRLTRGAMKVEDAKELVEEYVRSLMGGELGDFSEDDREVEDAILAYIAKIDDLITGQLNEIMHASEFQQLEASWRGLNHLVSATEAGPKISIRVLNVSKKELLKDMKQAKKPEQSAFFKKVYEEEFGTFGGEPFGALIGDYEFTNEPEDILLLERISEVAAAAHAPFFTAASPQLFGWKSFTELTDVNVLANIFTGKEYVKWRSFRDSEDSRYVGLCLPHTLMRLPYGRKTDPTESFNFEEDVDGHEHSKYLWGNAAYSLGTCLTRAFADYEWCAHIRGPKGGGMVEDLPVHTFETDQGDVALKCPTEIAITDRREKEFSELGFIPLVHCKGKAYAAFFGAQSVNKPRRYNEESANANARLSAQMQYIMAVSRIAHYLKAMVRDYVGSFMERSECEEFLNDWIAQYVTEDDKAPEAIKAKKPLREASIKVFDVPGKPGAYSAVAFLRPHFQLEELTVSLRLVAELPRPLGG